MQLRRTPPPHRSFPFILADSNIGVVLEVVEEEPNTADCCGSCDGSYRVGARVGKPDKSSKVLVHVNLVNWSRFCMRCSSG